MVIRHEVWVWTELAVEVYLHPILNRLGHGSPQTRRDGVKPRVSFVIAGGV